MRVVSGTTTVGGFVGSNDADTVYSKNYFNTTTAGRTNAIGGGAGSVANQMEGYDTATMRIEGTYSTWDFSTIWQSAPGSYPILQ